MSNKPILYENRHYAVVQKPIITELETKEGYALINRETGVEEFTTAILPQAYMQAAQLHQMMEMKLWEKGMDFADREEDEDSHGLILDMIDNDEGPPH